MDMKQLYSRIVMQHANSTDYKHELADANLTERGHNPSCGDNITLTLRLEGDTIAEAAFTGHGCAISQASTSMMCQQIEGKTLEEAKASTEAFLGMIKGEDQDEEALEDLIGDAVALKDIAHMPQRVKCAVLAWHTLDDILKEKGVEGEAVAD